MNVDGLEERLDTVDVDAVVCGVDNVICGVDDVVCGVDDVVCGVDDVVCGPRCGVWRRGSGW